MRIKRIRSDVQRACDVLRVTGNNLLHPGQIDTGDTRHETAVGLFRLINLIVEQAISEPRHVAQLYEGLEPSKREHIAQRDRLADDLDVS